MTNPSDAGSARNAHHHERDHHHHADPEQAWLSATEADTPGGLLHAGDTSDEPEDDHAATPPPATTSAAPASYPQESANADRSTGESLGDLARTARGSGQRHRKGEAGSLPAGHHTDDQHPQ